MTKLPFVIIFSILFSLAPSVFAGDTSFHSNNIVLADYDDDSFFENPDDWDTHRASWCIRHPESCENASPAEKAMWCRQNPQLCEDEYQINETKDRH